MLVNSHRFLTNIEESNRTRVKSEMKATLQLVVVLATMIAAAVAAINLDEQLERDEIIEAVNAAGSTWKVC